MWRSSSSPGLLRCVSPGLCALLSLLLFSSGHRAAAQADATAEGLRVRGPGVSPHLAFACCEHGVGEMEALFADPGVIAALRDLHAGIAIPILDFTPQRAAVVQHLNHAAVPVIAWIMLSREQGYYLNADNAPQAAERMAAFDKWTADNRLQWAAVGLDVEPDFGEFSQLKGHPWRLIATLLRGSVDFSRIAHAREAYSRLIDQIRARGYPVQIYQMPYIPVERSAHSSLPDRLLGTVDVHADEEYRMLYTTDARPAGAGMIWMLGQGAQGIVVGSTDGDLPAGSGSGPLSWDEFSRDLIVASHFSTHIGVYDLEGCVRQGFLPRLETMDWNQSVVIPAASLHRAERLHFLIRSLLWISAHLLYLAGIAVLLIAWMVQRRRFRAREL